MRRIAAITLLLVAFAAPALVRGERDNGRIPDLAGIWYMNGHEDAPCEIVQRRPDGRALFINERGSEAWGTVRGDRVFIPDWTDGEGSQGLRGRIRGDRIIWPNGSYWCR
jgi:hypothetical protein